MAGNLSRYELQKYNGYRINIFLDKIKRQEPFKLITETNKMTDVVLDSNIIPELTNYLKLKDNYKFPIKTTHGFNIYLSDLKKTSEFKAKNVKNKGNMSEIAFSVILAEKMRCNSLITIDNFYQKIEKIEKCHSLVKTKVSEILEYQDDYLHLYFPKHEFVDLINSPNEMEIIIESCLIFANYNSILPNKKAFIQSCGLKNQKSSKSDIILNYENVNKEISLKAGGTTKIADVSISNRDSIIRTDNYILDELYNIQDINSILCRIIAYHSYMDNPDIILLNLKTNYYPGYYIMTFDKLSNILKNMKINRIRDKNRIIFVQDGYQDPGGRILQIRLQIRQDRSYYTIEYGSRLKELLTEEKGIY